MGEGVTNPVRGAASSSSVHSTAEVVITSLLYADPFETCLHLIVVVSLACAFAAHWVINKRKDSSRTSSELIQSVEKDTLLCGPEHSTHFSCSLKASGGVVDTGLTRKSEPHLRRSVIVCKTGRSVSSLEKDSHCITASSDLDKCASDQPPNIMDTSGDVPPQPDSFFTWDSGGSSGEYSFVHTAVELPKYPDGSITEEEKQMLLLYMQTGHPELLLSSSQPGNMSPAQGATDSMLCDPAAAARGFLETIVEENSDDLRSPSECDEASVGWGSWDESDEDRMTVVEMVTSANHSSDVFPEPVYTSAEISNHKGITSDQFLSVGTSPNQSISSFSAGEDSFPDGRNTNFSLLDGRRDEANSRVLSCETSVDNSHPIENRGVSLMDNKTTQECDDVFFEINSETKPTSSDVCRQQGVSPVLNSLVSSNVVHSAFDTLWISADGLESPSETQDPWIVNRFLDPNVNSDADLSSLDFTINRNISKHEDSLLFLGSDDICLVPSPNPKNVKENDPETLMFSDSFKDYFLPTENYVPGFNKDDITNLGELAQEPLSTSSTDSATSKGLRCFRIGFEPTPTEQFSVSYLDQSMISDDCDQKSHSYNNNDSDSEKPKTESDLQETMFSPVEGDIVYGSSWVSSRPLKEPEKISSGAEVHCSTAQTEVRCDPTMLSESPPPDNNRRAFEQSVSDDETLEVTNSLSRWRHHTDLQHVQEGTSPIARWQHETNLHVSEGKQTESEESDDGLPPQLKEIYSSFKMRDNKMGRIRIKEDKNNNFKRLGLWDNESKVTLPPFNLSNTVTDNLTSKQKESNGASREDLDDLDIDMFAIANSNDCPKPAANGDSDVDDALRSFNHLDDYTSDENSENENRINLNEKLENTESETIVTDTSHDSIDNANTELVSLSTNMLSPENPCSDNSDNCPLCTDPSFKNTHINDIFSLKNNDHVEEDIQSLLQKTYPKMVRLSQSNLSDPEIHELTSGSNKAADSMSPLTSSDSDEGNRKTKEIKKRVKKRSKENSNTELKHDDSGYVEDDEDDDEEDSLGEKKEKRSSPRTTNPDVIGHTRKSLSSVYFESKSLKSESIDPQASNYAIPESFQEFSKQLEQSLTGEELKAGLLEGEKWNIPENLSQFSAWLLDNELKKLSTRNEMEKLFVDDIMSLREQTIVKFLKNSCSVEEKNTLKPLNLLHSNTLDKQDSIPLKLEGLELENTNISLLKNNEDSVVESDKGDSKPEFSNLPEWDFPEETNNYVSDIKEHIDEIVDTNLLIQNQNSEIQIENHSSDDSSSASKDKTDSDNELAEEYFNYNFNKQVSKVFNLSNSDQSNIIPFSEEQSISDSAGNQIETNLTTAETESRENIERPSEGKQPQQINTSEAEVTHGSEPTTSCFKNYESDSNDHEYNGPADIKTDTSEVKPLTDNVETFNSHEQETETSIIYDPSASEDTIKTLLTKVNDTTIHQVPLTENGEKVLLELISSDDPKVLPSIGSVLNENIAMGVELANDVAPSIERQENYLDGSESAGPAFDLMTQGETSEERGAFEGCVVKEADDIGSLQAVAVSFKSDRETHVQSVACYAHCQDGTASLTSDNSHIAGVLDSVSVNNDNGAALHSGDSSQFIDKVNLIEENCVPEKSVASESEESGAKVNGEFMTLDCFADDANEACVTNVIEKENDAVVCSVKSDHPKDEVSEHCSSDNLKVEIEDSAFRENIIVDKNEFSDIPEERYIIALDDGLNISESAQQSESALNLQEFCDNEFESNKPDIVSCCEKSTFKVSTTPEIPVFRTEYKRSNSLGRESEEVFEPISTQSKSTPDLRRCHEQLRSSAPLSALLSKSVSQRIQDYLGSNSRSDKLLRSLPPHERSRHYRRICVSTETVVERAARFEARSQSSRPTTRDKSPFTYRSGSCPPSSMKNHTTWISERNYSKPTATVRPTIDTYRHGIYKISNGDATQKENLFEQITGYTKASHKNGDIYKISDGPSADHPSQKENLMELITGYSKATRVTHKPPVPPSAVHQSSLKTSRLKGRIASARKDFFEKISQPDLSVSTNSVQKDQSDDEDISSANGLNRFDEFRRSARAERARLAASHPDLGALEAAVRSSKRRIDQLKKKSGKKSEAPQPQQIAPMPSTKELCLPYRRCTGEIAWASCAQRVREATARRKQLQQLEIVDQRDFPEDGAVRAHPGAVAAEEDDDPHSAISGGALEFLGSRARSMDFLLDADNRERALPPENRLASSGGGARVKSEHELRIERSLQNLTIPDWYKQSAWSKKPKEGFILRRGSEGSAGESRKRWHGFSSSRTPSATSLTTTPTSYSQRNIVVPKRVTPTSGGDWRHVGSLVSSRESLTPASPASLSPREGTFQYTLSTSSLSRWSSSRLSTSSAPLTALSVHRSFRQPYLGWRAAAASSSGGGSRSSPGISPVNATTPLQGSRPESPRRGSQDHPFVYGLQQNQITSAATLRPDGSETTDSSRISPLALNTTNVFFNSNVEGPDAYDSTTATPNRFASVEMRRDRYSYTQSLYSGTVIVSPGTTDDDKRNYNIDQLISSLDQTDERLRSPHQPPPRIWMESSFVGTKKDGSEPAPNATRSIRIVPSDSTRAGASASGTVRGGTCATQTAMGEYVLRDFRRFGITL